MEKKVLYINACARSESRTDRIARALLEHLGGPYLPDFSCQYLHTLAAEYFGIPETELICAEMLDVEGFDADNLVAQQIGQIQKRKLL